MSADDRARVTSAGGQARAAALTAEERAAIARQGAAHTNAPAALARRIVKAWPTLDADEQAEVIAVLTEALPLSRRRTKERTQPPWRDG